MLTRIWAIAQNTFIEIIRQPIYGIVIIATVILLIISPSLTMFTVDDDNKLLMDIGLSTLLVSGLLLAVFSATTVITDEIENKTVLTIITKTVNRNIFVISKFIGIVLAVVLAQYFLSLVYLMIIRHGVLQTASDEHDWVVISLGGGSALLIGIVSVFGNLFYRWRFSSTAIVLGSILATLVFAALCLLDKEWAVNPAENHIQFKLVGPIFLVMLATLTLSSIAMAAATRFNLVVTLFICAIFFILGASIHYWLGPHTDNDGITGYLAWAALAVVPSINVYVVTNAIFEEIAVPISYIGQTALYSAFYVMAALLFAIVCFRHRDMG